MEHQPNPFDGFEVISTYTDEQALEDGGLVAITQTDRVSRAVWEWLVEKQPKNSQPPNCWPVDMMTWFRAGNIPKHEALSMIAKHGKDEAQRLFERQVKDKKAAAMVLGIIRTHSKRVRQVYEENIGGGIFHLFPIVTGDAITSLELAGLEVDGEPQGVRLWLIPNENGGITLMFPEDY